MRNTPVEANEFNAALLAYFAKLGINQGLHPFRVVREVTPEEVGEGLFLGRMAVDRLGLLIFEAQALKAA